ncbi:MAG: hypothetical protein ACP5O8_01150 [Candidatus Aenigmatarchaeota archaeon]
MEEKTMLGIGYILSLIPGINIIGAILLIVGWIKLGGKYNENLWKWVGYLGILSIIATILILSTMMGSILTGNVEALFGALLTTIPVLALMIAYWIAQGVGLWSAGKKFNSGLLKAGGVLSITIVLSFLGSLLAGIGFLLLKEK